MTKLTGVGTVISVGHNSPEGIAHGHSYEIVAWYRFGHDARTLLTHLEAVTRPLCHTVLSDELRLAENLAEHIAAKLPGCVEVEVRRPLERLYSRSMAASGMEAGTVETEGLDPKDDSPTASGGDAKPIVGRTT